MWTSWCQPNLREDVLILCSYSCPYRSDQDVPVNLQQDKWYSLFRNFSLCVKECVILFFSFIFISWRLITLHYCSGFCHTLAWISHGFTCVPHPDPPPTFLPIPSLWVFPVHQASAVVSCIQPGLAICLTLDNIHVSMLFSQIIPPSPSPTESKSLFYTSVSLFLSAYSVIVTIFLNSTYMC